MKAFGKASAPRPGPFSTPRHVAPMPQKKPKKPGLTLQGPDQGAGMNDMARMMAAGGSL